MKVSLAYGRGSIDLDLPDDRTTVIAPAISSDLKFPVICGEVRSDKRLDYATRSNLD